MLVIPFNSPFGATAHPSALAAGFFVFGDLSVKCEGEYRVKFHLYEVVKYVYHIGVI